MYEAHDEYIRKLYILSKSDPSAWENFVIAFHNYAHSELERSLKVVVKEAAMALGMSRRIIELRDEFRNVQTIMAKIAK